MSCLLNNLHRRFDHAALQPDVTEEAVRKLCDEARLYDFYCVAVNPVWVRTAREALQGSRVRILSVAGFPLGASRTDVKVIEAAKGVSDGAHEIDMVANIGWLRAAHFSDAEREIAEVRRALAHNIILKVIIEAGFLTEEQQIEATKSVINGGGQFVKTCTGFFGGATVEQVKTLYRAAGGKIEVKASGGIRTFDQCRQLLEAGATRLGSSASVAIMQELQEQ
ncbi:MAG TPA: deoxyribose-phosphate aldolase [Candidatus Deferrimicrobium sp.]|nr:deoxyribose-phosphate aldolase [Candidatus Deferrimicrobium sp.]